MFLPSFPFPLIICCLCNLSYNYIWWWYELLYNSKSITYSKNFNFSPLILILIWNLRPFTIWPQSTLFKLINNPMYPSLQSFYSLFIHRAFPVYHYAHSFALVSLVLNTHPMRPIYLNLSLSFKNQLQQHFMWTLFFLVLGVSIFLLDFLFYIICLHVCNGC